MEAIYGLADLEFVAKALWEEQRNEKIWLFQAPMGSGKTTLIAALAKYLKVNDAVSSPTFALINTYKSAVAGVIHHMDWYRINDEEEAIHAGIEDALWSGHLAWIEWPEKLVQLLPDQYLVIHIEILDEKTRRLYTDNVLESA